MIQHMELAGGKVVPVEGREGDIQVYLDPTDVERRHLVDTLKIDEHTLSSALDPDELARLEFEPDHLAMILKRPRNYSSEDQFVFKVASAGIFLYSDRLVIVLTEDVPLFQGKLFTKLTTLKDVALRIVYMSIAHFVEHLKVINAVSDSLEQQINTSMQNKYLLNLFSLEKSLVYYLNGINSNAKLIERLKLNAAKIGFSPENIEFIDDAIIENQQCYEQAEIYSNILASMMDARVSIVSNNLNWLMKTLTIITICIMTPTLVVSIFSMNVPFPGTDHPAAFWFILALALSSIGLVRLVWRWKRW
ncbi:MAG TPA: magnesium transporter CorA family protein [Thermoguttaceae bacterium]|nr:magnesium transporter CorA family protein [Thermoguttaceae bacterium]